MSGLEVNKILASIILAILVVTVIGHLGDIIIDTEHHEMEETAYKIDVPESGEVVPGAAPKVEVIEPISLLLASASLEKGEKLFKKCSSCHNYEKDSANKVGPLAEYGGEWSYEELAEFLYKPKKFVKGTKMNFAGLKKVQDRANIVLFLREQAENPVPLP